MATPSNYTLADVFARLVELRFFERCAERRLTQHKSLMITFTHTVMIRTVIIAFLDSLENSDVEKYFYYFCEA